MVWEQRWHPLRREWVVVSSHRNERPWQGERVDATARALPPYVKDCYLCPGNVRSWGQRTDRYTGVFVFDNDHPCVGPGAPTELAAPPGIYRNRRASGCARVVCFTPRHDLTLARLPANEIVHLLEVLQAQYRELGAREDVRHVLVFENKGEVVGVSNPHPHCQIYATNFVFKTIEIEAAAQAAHLAADGRPLFQDILAAEEADGRRLLVRRDQALSFVPYFARYPYETFVAPRATHPSLAHLSAAELVDFAAALRETLIRLDNPWHMAFPYVVVVHPAPPDGPPPTRFPLPLPIPPAPPQPGLLKYLAGPAICRR